jgi:hypothetical protein
LGTTGASSVAFSSFFSSAGFSSLISPFDSLTSGEAPVVAPVVPADEIFGFAGWHPVNSVAAMAPINRAAKIAAQAFTFCMSHFSQSSEN